MFSLGTMFSFHILKMCMFGQLEDSRFAPGGVHVRLRGVYMYVQGVFPAIFSTSVLKIGASRPPRHHRVQGR